MTVNTDIECFSIIDQNFLLCIDSIAHLFVFHKTMVDYTL